ncbi:MAG: hypothetical protein LBK95_08210 [Bifidobacteriaceae bacterium]|nr:hypothetical protein [Bifidobacteriaceae bacterium]
MTKADDAARSPWRWVRRVAAGVCFAALAAGAGCTGGDTEVDDAVGEGGACDAQLTGAKVGDDADVQWVSEPDGVVGGGGLGGTSAGSDDSGGHSRDDSGDVDSSDASRNDSGDEEVLTALAAEVDLGAAPYFPIGTGIDLEFSGALGPLIDVAVRETPVTVDGEARWNGWHSVELETGGDSVRFDLPQNVATGFSSDSRDYEPRSSLRGFVLTVTCEGDIQRYAFALRTDPFLTD